MNDTSTVTAASKPAPMPGAAIDKINLLQERQTRAAASRFQERAEARGRARTLKEKGLFFALDEPARIAERAARRTGQTQPSAALLGAVTRLANVPAPNLTAAFERIIGQNDLLPIAYLTRGEAVAEAVGRVVVKDAQGRDAAYGTAFLVAPDVIITNHHVLPDAETAGQSVIQFHYQAAADGQMERFQEVRTDPGKYLPNEELDFALVGISPGADGGARPVLPLIGSPAKIVSDESVTIIEHPGAQPKQVALRDNKVIDILPDFLHYTTDTEHGASGSPVFNDQWEVVALHHAAVPGTDDSDNGATARAANEGVRISRIVAYLKELRNLPPSTQQLVNSVLSQEPNVPSMPPPLAASSVGIGTREDLRGASAADPRASTIAIPGPEGMEITISVKSVGARSSPLPGAAQEGILGDVAGKARQAAGALADQALALVGKRRPLPDFIQQLQPGDVLLYNGNGVLSDAIKYFTDSDVSHSAIYLGGAGNGAIGEAVDAGVIRDTREQSFPGHNWVVVHRFHDKRDMAPVLAVTNKYLSQGLQYAYPKLVFLGILLLVKKVRPAGVLGKMVQAVFVAAAEALNRFVESGKDLMICSEFVYRSYDEAEPGTSNPFHLDIPQVVRESYVPGVGAYPGIEAGSIASHLLAKPSALHSNFAVAAESTYAAPPLDHELLEKDAEKLVADYLAEVRFGRVQRVTEEFVPLDQLYDGVSKFAIALATVRNRATGKTREEALALASQLAPVGLALPPALQALFRTPADFVTPADLRSSDSLVEVGRAY